MAVSIGPRIGIEGEKEYRQQIQNIIQAQKTLTAEMKATSAAFDENATQEDRLKLKQRELTRSLELQNQKLKVQKELLQGAVSKWGESDTRTLKYKQSVASTTEQINKLNTSLNETKNKINNIKFEKMSENLGKVSSTMDDVAHKTRMLSVAMVGGMTLATKSASDYVENINKTEEAFKTAAGAVKEFSKTSLENYGIDKSQALEMASLYGDMATSMGVTRDEAAKLSTSLVGLAGDLASFKNMNIQEVNTALTGIFTGETKSLKQLGVVMTETNLKAYALSQGFKTQYKDMSQAEKVMLRYRYVLSVTKNSQGDFARTRNEAANSMRVLQGQVKELAIDLGQQLLPIAKQVMHEAINLVRGFNKLSDSQKSAVVATMAFLAAISPTASAISGVTKAVDLGVKAMNAIKVANAAAGASYLGMLGPIGLAVAAIGGLVVALKKYDDFQFSNTKTAKYLKQTKADFDSLRQSVAQSTEQLKNSSDTLSGSGWADDSRINALGNRYIELASKTKRTASESAELKAVAGQLTNALPGLAGRIDSVTGAYKGQIGSIQAVIQAQIQLARAQSMTLKIADMENKQIELNRQKQQALEQYSGDAKLVRKAYSKADVVLPAHSRYGALSYAPTYYKMSPYLNREYREARHRFDDSAKLLSDAYANAQQNQKKIDANKKELIKLLETNAKFEKKHANALKNPITAQDGGGRNVGGGSVGGGSGGGRSATKAKVKSALEKAKESLSLHPIPIKKQVDYWQDLLKHTKKGTDEYGKIQQAFVNANKQYNKALETLSVKHLRKIQEIEKKGVAEIQARNKAYKKALEDRKTALRSQFKLFDKLEKKERKNPWELQQNLSSQVQGFKDWQNDISILQKKGVKKDMIDEIKAMGIDARDQVKAMTEMTDNELMNYVTVWEEFNKDLGKTAENELEPMKKATEKANHEMAKSMKKALDKANRTYTNDLKRLGMNGKSVAETAGRNTINGLLNGLKSKDAEIRGYLKELQDLVASSFSANVSVKTKKQKTPKHTGAKPKKKADGGYVGKGSLFIAGEAGAELVGSMNGRTAVANRSQMGEALGRAIAPYLDKVLGGKQNFNAQRPIVLYNTTVTQIDGRTIDKQVTRRVMTNINRDKVAFEMSRGGASI